MDRLIFFLILAFVFSVIFFGYRTDYRRNPAQFFKTIFVMPAELLLRTMGLYCIAEKLLRRFKNGLRR